MDLAYSRFASDVVRVIQEIAESHFVAFDLEFSGIAERSQQRIPGKPTLQELYAETRIAATKYQVLQVGLAIVKEDQKNGQYIVKPYNFNISPLPTLRERTFVRDWSMSSGAVQFLVRNRFDFGLPFTTGIPYLSRAEEVQARLTLSGENDRKRPDMILKAEDENLVKHIRTTITTWQEQPKEEREKYLNIPNDDRGKGVPGVLNRYQMRLTHQVIQNEYPNLKTAGMREFVQVTDPTEEERKRQNVLLNEHIDREIGRAIGFRWILEAIVGRDISGMPDECFLAAVSQFPPSRENQTAFQGFVTGLNQKLSRRRRVLVGHNCFTDLIYLHQFFVGELPDRVEDFQDSIRELFPAVVDTKHIASFGEGRWGDTSLAAVEEGLREEEVPVIVVPPEFDRYSFNEKPHEAGYDAMLTANIAIKLSSKMERDGKYCANEGSSDQEEPRAINVMFGVKEEGYVTASEDFDGVSTNDLAASMEVVTPDANDSRNDSTNSQSADAKQGEDLLSASSALVATPGETSMPASSTNEHGNVVAVKERKSKPINWNSTAEVEKVRGSFAATNIFEVLADETDSKPLGEDSDLISFSDTDSTATKTRNSMISGSYVSEMVKEGKLMPRWEGGNRFWQILGNRLQVNSSKEGVFEL